MLSVVMLSVVAQYIHLGFSPVFKFWMEQHIFDIFIWYRGHHWKGTQVSYTYGLYYKCFTIVIYDRNDNGLYYKTTITIIIDDHSYF
jgi:hypothetical protein